MAASGGNEDNEVYAVAKAVDEGEEFDEDDLDALAADKKRIDPLPALDHANIEYDSFAKDFYEEVPEIARMQPAEVPNDAIGHAMLTEGLIQEYKFSTKLYRHQTAARFFQFCILQFAGKIVGHSWQLE